MDLAKKRSSTEKKKDKKKKHDHSRSDDKKKKKYDDRDGSRQRKKKDKDKKHHKDKSRSKEREKQKERKDKERERERPKQFQRQLERSREFQKEKEREVQKSRDKDKDKARQKQRERQKQKERERDREREKDKAKDRDHERSREKKQEKDRRDKSRQKKDQKRRQNDRSRKEFARQDKYERWRRQRDGYRFDSPPKSDESQRSEDFQNMDRLNKMKAEKQLVSSKADRKLYLGNLPPNITSAQLMQMLNSALIKMQINTDVEGDSIISAWVSPDGIGHYAFVQFRNAQEATAGLALNGASLYGYQLKLGRPKQYIEYHKQLLSQFGSDGNIDTILRKVEAMGGFGQHLIVQERLVHPPSKVLMLKHIVTIEELAIDEQYRQIVEDVTEMAKRHGDVIKIVVPRPMEIDLQEVKKRVKGLGFIFIKYKSVEQSKYARKEFSKQMFSDRSVACSYFSQQRFDQGDLDPIQKIVIDF